MLPMEVHEEMTLTKTLMSKKNIGTRRLLFAPPHIVLYTITYQKYLFSIDVDIR